MLFVRPQFSLAYAITLRCDRFVAVYSNDVLATEVAPMSQRMDHGLHIFVEPVCNALELNMNAAELRTVQLNTCQDDAIRLEVVLICIMYAPFVCSITTPSSGQRGAVLFGETSRLMSILTSI